MDAELLLRDRHVLSETAFVELAIWRVPHPVLGSSHPFKYRLALVSEICVLRYDNEAGKDDHKHRAEVHEAYHFKDLDCLQADFWADVETWRSNQ